ATTASPATSAPNSDDLFAAEAAVIEGLRKAALFVLGTAMQTYGAKMADEQEAVSFTADVIIAAYAAESALLRARQAQKDDAPRAALHAAAARITAHTAAARAAAAAREALAAMTTGQ